MIVIMKNRIGGGAVKSLGGESLKVVDNEENKEFSHLSY